MVVPPRATVAILASVLVLGIAPAVESARRCGRARCRETIVARCGGPIAATERRECRRRVLDDCRAGRCVCRNGALESCKVCTYRNLGDGCGHCGTGECAVEALRLDGAPRDCGRISCVAADQPSCFASGTTGPPACSSEASSCSLTGSLASYYCNRGLLAGAICTMPCP